MRAKNHKGGLPARDWEPLFRKVGVERDRLDVAKSERGKTTILGNFLAQNVDREVPIAVNGRTGKATLRMKKGRSNTKQYYFEIVWDEPDGKGPSSPDGTGGATGGAAHQEEQRNTDEAANESLRAPSATSEVAPAGATEKVDASSTPIANNATAARAEVGHTQTGKKPPSKKQTAQKKSVGNHEDWN
jgi:hypothetical protein